MFPSFVNHLNLRTNIIIIHAARQQESGLKARQSDKKPAVKPIKVKKIL